MNTINKSESFDRLTHDINNCTHCELFKTRKQAVIGDGSIDADLLFIGEAPGYNEDKKGIPFVGRAGAILDELLESIQLQRSHIYIANILKCRPPKNRNPSKHEIKACTPHLEKQIELIQPRVIIPMGSFSTEYIFNKFDLEFTKISELHGKLFSINTLFGPIHILPMYHPAVATYNPNKKSVLLDDINKVKPFINMQSVKS